MEWWMDCVEMEETTAVDKAKWNWQARLLLRATATNRRLSKGKHVTPLSEAKIRNHKSDRQNK
jgi:hypothetical protein